MSHEMHPPTELNITHMAQRPDYSRAQGGISARQIIDGINHAVTRTQRYHALQISLHAFHHSKEDMHNYEIDLGAAHALCLKLGYILLQSHGVPTDDVCTEISMVCRALTMIYGCSVERRLVSFREIGLTELFPLLVQVLRSAIALEHEHFISAVQLDAVFHTLVLIRIFAKLEPAKSCIIHCSQVLSVLVQLLWTGNTSSANDANALVLHGKKDVMSTVKLEALGILKDLAFRSKDCDKSVLFHFKGLLHTLLHICQSPTSGPRPLKEYASAILWNFAMAKTLDQAMARDSDVLNALDALMMMTDGIVSVKARRNAVSALGNLAVDVTNQEFIIQHENGSLIRHLMSAAQSDDADCRRRAMRTIRCILPGDASRSLRQQDDFVSFLSQIATNAADNDTRIQACECMGHLITDQEASTKFGLILSKALMEAMEKSLDRRVTLVACRLLVPCLSALSPHDLIDELTPALFARWESAVTDTISADAHRSVARVIATFATDDDCRNKMTCTPALNVLSAFLSQFGPDFEASRVDAIRVINALVDIESNKRPMAEHNALLTALVNFALATTEGVEKDEAKSLILKLVPEL